MKIRLVIASILLLVSVAMPSYSAVIYDESLSGEFDGFGDPPTKFDLASGTNTFIGSSFFRQPTLPNSDSDVFGFVVPDYHLLTSIIFEYNVTNVFGDLRSLGLRYQIALTGDDGTFDKTGAISATADVDFIYSDGSNPNTPVSPSPIALDLRDVVNSSATETLTLPLSSGLYWLVDGKNMSGLQSLGEYGGEWDYTLTFNVTRPSPRSHLAIRHWPSRFNRV